jgi:hypothetical protein
MRAKPERDISQKILWLQYAVRDVFINIMFIIHTFHSRFIPEGVAEVSQIFLRDTHAIPK